MILDTESWMNVRRFRALHAAGATYAEIARECGCDWRTVRKYLDEDAPSVPPVSPSRAGTQPKLITPFEGVIEAWLRADVTLKASVVHERLVAQHGFTGNYQRTKMFIAEARPRIVAELAEGDENPLTGLHRRFEVVPGAQAQVDWGDEGDLLAHVGIKNVYSFHLTLSHSRDPFTCFTTSMDLATFWDCHRRAFAHFGGVPGSIVGEYVPRNVLANNKAWTSVLLTEPPSPGPLTVHHQPRPVQGLAAREALRGGHWCTVERAADMFDVAVVHTERCRAGLRHRAQSTGRPAGWSGRPLLAVRW
jgi:transposase